MERPTYIDIAESSSRAPSSASARLGQLSPRILHSHGDIPPALSPLDAFAAESRRLAKELEATRLAGEKRMSRLPPALVTHSLYQHQANRPACFRSLSNATPEPVPQIPSHLDLQRAALNPTVTEPFERPQSSYPHLGGARANTEGEDEEVFSTPRESLFPQSTSYFEISHNEPTHEITESPVKITANELSAQSTNKRESDKHSANLLEGLAPPNAAFARSKLYPESSDDDYQSSNAGSTFSRPRKLSASSGTSFPTSPAIPNHDRKGSNDSDTSLASLKPQRQPTMNFSRPLSSMSFHLRSDTPSQLHPEKTLERKPSHFSEMSREGASFEDDRSVASDGFVTYTHNKFTLPRGRAIEKASNRISTMFLGLSTSDFQMEPLFSGPTSVKEGGDEYVDGNSVSSVRGSNELALHKPGESLTPDSRGQSRPVSNVQTRKVQTSDEETTISPDSNEEEDHVTPLPDARLSSATSSSFPKRRSSLMINTFSFRDDDDTNYKVSTLSPIPGSTADAQSEQSYSTSNKSESTVRPSTARTNTNYQELSADDHVEKAIKLHEHGDLKESTYHLRIAVKQNHPTAMLLYALACRHGWGMRANPKEGVAWLRKAVDTAMLEVAADEDAESDKPKPDFNAKKSHQAQFALTVYELGVSHLNGWGVEQDKALALRCFEIAGNWGDTDALTEAGFCYAQGVGCKKDLKKAAKFYRRAAEKGVSMVGNSWIYKDKYLDQDDVNNDNNKRKSRSKGKDGDQNRKARDKSKTRSIWSWKKSVPASTGEA